MSVLNDGDRNDIIREYRRQEYLDRKAFEDLNREDEKGCGNCRWHTQEAGTREWLCDNEDSDYCMDYTGYEDCCSEWERR